MKVIITGLRTAIDDFGPFDIVEEPATLEQAARTLNSATDGVCVLGYNLSKDEILNLAINCDAVIGLLYRGVYDSIWQPTIDTGANIVVPINLDDPSELVNANSIFFPSSESEDYFEGIDQYDFPNSSGDDEEEDDTEIDFSTSEIISGDYKEGE